MKQKLEVGDIFRKYGAAFRAVHPLGLEQQKVMTAIERCRTVQLGGHINRCADCKHGEISYNSCRNRHCPKCQGLRKEKWVEERKEELLPIPYFHLVFTLPAALHGLIRNNERLAYQLLFKAVWETISELSNDPKYLGAEPGMTAVLHTWGQNLHFHPHLHCIVTGGGLAKDTQQWIPSAPQFFLPVRVLSAVFRGKYLAGLKRAFEKEQLIYRGEITALSIPANFQTLMQTCYKQAWVVYAKRPFGGPEQVIAYLGRYTHRVAISNHRLIEIKDERVHFWWKDYRKGNKKRRMSLAVNEFIRRFLLHVLPKGFHHIRHFGIVAPNRKKVALAVCRKVLPHATLYEKATTDALIEKLLGRPLNTCPKCNKRRFNPVAEIPARPPPNVQKIPAIKTTIK